jgi:Fe2+ or Zn2+ uptake regulation protein
MATSDLKPTRPWREVAELVLQEQDHVKALELAEELIRALDAESRRHMDQVKAEDKAKEKVA